MNARARIRQRARTMFDVPASGPALTGGSALAIMRSALNGAVGVAASRRLPGRCARTRIRQQAWQSLRIGALAQLPTYAEPRQERTSGLAVVGQLPQLGPGAPQILA